MGAHQADLGVYTPSQAHHTLGGRARARAAAGVWHQVRRAYISNPIQEDLAGLQSGELDRAQTLVITFCRLLDAFAG